MSQEKLSLLFVVEADTFSVVSTVAALATVENAKVVLDITVQSAIATLVAFSIPCLFIGLITPFKINLKGNLPYFEFLS